MTAPLSLPWRLGILFAVAFALAFGGDSVAAQKNKQTNRRRNQQNAAKAAEAREQAAVRAANAQIAAAKKVLAAAESKEEGAKARLKSAVAGLRNASQELDDAQDTVRQLAKDLAEIEAEILADQNADSPYAKAAEAVAEAKAELKATEDRLLAGNIPRDSIAKHSDHVEATARLAAAAATAEAQRRELFRGDSDWRAAAEALTTARQEQNQAAGETGAGSAKRKDAAENLDQAQDAMAAARAAIRKAEAVISRAKSSGKNKARPGNNPPGKKNSKS